VGNPPQPVFVFFFDEAHLLFRDAPKALVEKVEQVARLIRSKGVGVYFVSQNADDVPETILGQLGNRFQHGLRAYTPRERKAVTAAAESFRPNPAFDTVTAIGELGTGEALVSLLDAKGVPGIVQRTLIRPPSSMVGPIPQEARAAIIAASTLGAKYGAAVDRDSAYEEIRRRMERPAGPAAPDPAPEPVPAPDREFRSGRRYGEPARQRRDEPAPRRSSRSDSIGETLAKTVIRSAGSQVTRQLVRGVLGSLFR
jgi:DNA helicase HerA-like ATPase